MTSKFIALSALAFGLAAGCSSNNQYPSSQYPYPDRGGRVERNGGGGQLRIDDALRDIRLSYDQQRAINDIQGRYDRAMREERREGDRQDLHELHQRELNDIRGVLDREQQRLFDRNLRDMRY